MVQRRAITHKDLVPSPPSTDLGSRRAALLMVLTILCGLCCFTLCLMAEVFRSKVTWESNGNDGNYQCVYTSSGETPLLCAAIAFVGLAITMVVQHLYLLIAISKSPPPALISLDPYSTPAKTITWIAGIFFVTSWMCFGVGEILLLIGLSVESGHLKNWTRPRPSCLIIKQGLFSAAGVFALLTVFLATGLYITALHAQRISQEHENVRQQILEASASSLNSPPRRITTIARENPVVVDNQIEQPSFISQELEYSVKQKQIMHSLVSLGL